MEHKDWGRADALDGYWDTVLAGGPPVRPAAVDDVAAAVIAHLGGGQGAKADEAARERTRLRILAQAQSMEASMGMQHDIHPAVLPGALGSLPQPTRSRKRWATTQLATAALLVLTMVMGLVTFGQRSGNTEPPLSHLAAPSAQVPAASTPEASPSAATGLAEFVAEIQLGSDSLSTPTGLAVGADGTLYAIDAIQDHIRLFAADGQPMGTWGETGQQLGQFRFHEGTGFEGDLAFGPDGDLYVLDTFNSRIQVLDTDGAVVRAWGEAGTEEGQFALPSGLAVDGVGRVYVADTENRRVQVFDADGQFLEAWATPEDGGQRLSPVDVTVDSAGIVSVTDGTAKQITRFDSSGAIVAAFGSEDSGSEGLGDPWGVVSDAQDNLYVADFARSQIQVFAPDGTLLGSIGEAGLQPGQLITPVNLAFGPEGLLYVSEQGNRRIQVFRLRSLPNSEREIITETLIDVADVALPAEHAQIYAMTTELQPGVSAALDGQVGTFSYRVEQGTVRIIHADVEQIVRAGEQWSAPVVGVAAFENVGDGVARIVEADVLDATATSSLDANYASKFSDPQGGMDTFAINAATTFAGGSGRLVLERMTLLSGSSLEPYAQPKFAWVGIVAGRLGVTLHGEDLPFRWDSGEERTFGLYQSLPVIPVGTEVTLRNADELPLVLYRLTIEPDDSGGPPGATPAP